MKRGRREKEYMGPAAAALRRRPVFRDARASSTQLTAAQLIADAQEMQRMADPGNDSTRVVINSPEELALYRQKTRTDLEERVKRGYSLLGNWVKYARWEAQQKDFERMRSVLERAVKFHGTNPVLWRDYAELEEEYGFVNHARGVWDRGVTALPAAVDLWLKYLVLEQAVGQESRVRDVFNRWLSGPTPPNCAWELFALFEAQQQRADACRDVMRRYVEAHGTVEAWLFYGATELNVLSNTERAVKVYATAIDSLPEEYTNGEKDCRVPLACAEALAAAKKFDEARDVYHRLLRDCTYVAALDNIFAAYSLFERLHGDAANYEVVAVAVAKAMYQQRIARDPCDFDAYVSQYLLLCSAARQCSNSAERNALEDESVKCLTAAANTHVDGCKDAAAAQRRAVVVMEYARLVEDRDLAAARAALASCIRDFPFSLATCPRLWVEASALEQRHGAYQQARKLLSAAVNVSPCSNVFDAALQLEEKAHEAGEISREDRVQRCRDILQNAIKKFPLDFSLWEKYAKMEEKEGQFCRADALRVACIRSFTTSSRAALSMAERYKLLEKVDEAWARRLALKRRLLRAVQKNLRKAGNPVDETETETEAAALRQMYRELLDSVWDEYKYEALRWKEKAASNSGVLASPPERMPEVLAPAIARWGEAVSAVTSFVLVPTQRTGEYEPSSVDWVRTVLREMLERERPELLREMGGFDDAASFDAVQQMKRWGEFLLTPIVTEWRRFEATYATPETLEAVTAFTQPTRRRTRLFAKKNLK
ncbi:crooked neck [Trypanosoma grayi]|uniref:crooked neck n=1 Tax=Trypanosoma grayi TaxID=71804 RepID=UPI0004F45B8F|nr:crooked neck [Trypanosoma grayi]KEG14595.1 crooked neck [Trypanosoma grayi]